MSDDKPRQELSIPAKAGLFARNVLDGGRMEALKASLPSHIKPERFERNLIIAVTQQPKLLNCNPAEVFAEVSKAAALGLYLDPQLGEAYLIVGYDGRRRCEVPQLRLGYRGLIKLGRQSGEIANLYAHEARKNDRLEIRLGTEKEIRHEPDYLVSEEDRGPVALYYAVVVFKDGSKDFEPMSVEAIEKIRDRSDGWKAFKDGKIKSTPWATDPGEMSKKTVLRRLMKRLPQSPEIAEALEIEDQDFREPVEIPRPSLRAKLPGPTHTTGGFSRDHVERQIAEAREEPQKAPTAAETLEGDDIPAEFTEVAGEPESTAAVDPAADLNVDDPGDDVFPGDAPPKSPEQIHREAWIQGTKDQADKIKAEGKSKADLQAWFAEVVLTDEWAEMAAGDETVKAQGLALKAYVMKVAKEIGQ